VLFTVPVAAERYDLATSKKQMGSQAAVASSCDTFVLVRRSRLLETTHHGHEHEIIVGNHVFSPRSNITDTNTDGLPER
jgi:hypothetical protein